jgi:putative SOS response-associated peptidase YedK
MCYYNKIKVSRAEFIRLMAIEKELKNLQLNRPAQSGFDYRDWPIIVPINGGKDFEIKNVHWEYIPAFIHDEAELSETRKMNTWLNAKSENLFLNDKGKSSMYKQGALHGRCLVLSSGFYEWRHVAKIGKKGQPLKATEAIPYHITLKGRPEYFYMAGVSREWTNQSRGESALTFAIVTTAANELMKKIHNKKERMPTILPESLAAEWIQDGLSEERIKEIARYRFPASQMEAWTVAKDFMKQQEPEKEFVYEALPALYEK